MIVTLKNISKSFKKVQAVEDVSFSINDNEIVSIIGPSGSGKSTLLRLIGQLEKPDKGDIVLFGTNMATPSSKAVKLARRKVGFIFQDYPLFDHLSVKDNIALAPLKVFKVDKTKIETITKNILATVGLSEKIDAYPSQLSDGQKQRVAIARALANDPSLILFDEPTSALDSEAINSLVEVILKLKKQGVTIIIVTHDLTFAKKVSTRLLFMEKSRIINDESVITLE